MREKMTKTAIKKNVLLNSELSTTTDTVKME